MALETSDTTLDRGDLAPSFSLTGTDGETYTLDSFDTTAVLVVFTCNHCPYAQAKFDLLNELAADYDDCAVVGINPNDETAYPNDSFAEMQARVEAGEIAYDAYLRDPDATAADAYGAACTPDPFLLRHTTDGYRLAYQGRLDDALNPDEQPTELYVRQAIDDVLAGQPVEPDPGPSQGCSIKWPTAE